MIYKTLRRKPKTEQHHKNLWSELRYTGYFQQYFSYIMATSFSGGKPEYPERTTNHGQAIGKLYHLRCESRTTLFVNELRRRRTHNMSFKIRDLNHW
jgi:hypothetical protein